MKVYYKLSTLTLLAFMCLGASTSQVNTYINGNTLTADQLNSEFSNIYSTLNAIDNANITTNAAILPTKISATIDGDGIARQSDGSLDVNVDGTTVTIVADELVIDDLPGNAIVNGGVDTAQLADESVTKAKEAIKTTATTATLGNVGLSADTGASVLTFSTSSTGDLSNNLVNLTTNGGPVMIRMLPGTSATNSYILCDDATTDPCILELDRGGSTVAKIEINAEGGEIKLPPGGFQWIDTQAAGTYAYKIKYAVGSATALKVLNVRLMAYEL